MRKVTIITGSDFDAVGNIISPQTRSDAIETVEVVAGNQFGGISYVDSHGSWKDGKGEIVRENGITFTLFTDASDSSIQAFARYVKNVFRQNSVVLSVSDGESVQFIE